MQLHTRLSFIILLLLQLGKPLLYSQVTIADAYPGCLTVSSQMGMSCGGGTSLFGVNGLGQFEVNNIDGIMCCGGSSGGSTDSYFQFPAVDISSYMNVTIMVDYSASNTAYEDDSPGAPIFGCTGMNIPDNSHDQIVFAYSIDGGPFIQDLYVHGLTPANFTGTWTSPPLNGMNIVLRVYAANKASAEAFYFENFIYKGTPKPISAGPDKEICSNGIANLMGSGVGTWSGGIGVFGNPNIPVTTYDPDAAESGTIQLTYSGHPATASCADDYPPPSDNMLVTINQGPVAELIGGGALCEGECTMIDVSINGGTAPYTLTMNFQVSSFPPINLPIVIPGFDVNEKITICLQGNIPSVDLVTNTITIPTFAAGFSGTMTLTNISDGNCPGITNNSSVSLTLIKKPTGNPAFGSVCDDGSGFGLFDFNALALESQVLGGGTGTVLFYSDMALTSFESNPYYGPPTTLYAQIEKNGCYSDPIPVYLDILPAGDVGQVFITCGSNSTSCDICDSDGIPGEDVEITFHLLQSASFDIEMIYFINSTQYTYSSTLNGPIASATFNLSSNATFALVSVTKNGECIDNTDLGNQVSISYHVQPNLTSPGILQSCDQITLPPITGTNLSGTTAYFTGPGGTGTPIAAGTTISQSTTLYAYSGSPSCYDEYELSIVITGVTTFDMPSDTNQCGPYVLPEISGTNVPTSSAYFTQAGGNGLIFYPGDTVTSSVDLYIYDPINPNCTTNEPNFSVTITPAPMIQNPDTVLICGSYILSNITGQNLTGNQAYFTMPNGNGNVIPLGTVIDTSKIIYAYDDNGLCSDEVAIHFIVRPTTLYDSLGDVIACNQYVLPNIGGQNVGANATYFTAPNGGGMQVAEGTVLTSPITLFIYDTTNMCQVNQPAINVTVTPGPQLDNIPIVNECGSYILPSISGVNLTGNQTYYTMPNGTGNQIAVGTLITDSTIIYAYDSNGACFTQQPLTINILPDPQSGVPQPISHCIIPQNTFNLFEALLTPYDLNGTWKEIGSSIFDLTNPQNVLIPNSVTPGVYNFRYTVLSPCGSSSSTINITLEQSPNAGSDGTLSLCSGLTTPVNLNQLLNGASSQTGNWTMANNPGINLSNPNSVNFSTLAANSYDFQYVLSNTKCSDTSLFTITILPAISAGDDASEQVCKGSIVDLSSLLTNQSSTDKFYDSNFTLLSNPNINTSTLLSTTYNYYHIIAGTSTCNADTALISLNVTDILNAGPDVKDTLCDLNTLNLNTLLGSSASGGQYKLIQGTGNLVGSNFTPQTAGNVSLSYTVGDGVICPVDEALIDLVFNAKPVVDISLNSLEVCENDVLSYNFIYTMSTGSNATIILQNEADHISGSGKTIYNQLFNQSTGNLQNNLNVNGTFPYPIIEGATYYIGVQSISKNQCNYTNFNNSFKPFKIYKSKSVTINPTICENEQISIGNVVIDKDHLKDTILLNTTHGCDSTVIVNAALLPTPQGNLKQNSICEGKSINIGSQVFDESHLSGQVTLANAAANGCDSLVNVNLSLAKNSVYNFDNNTCDILYSYTLEGNLFNQANPIGQVILSIPNAAGCDSIVNVNLTFLPLTADITTIPAPCEESEGIINIIGSNSLLSLKATLDGNTPIEVGEFPFSIYTSAGSHQLSIIDDLGCETSKNIEVGLSSGPIVSITTFYLSDGSNQITLNTSDSIYNIEWSPSFGLNCTDCKNPIASESGTYTVTYEYEDGCIGSQELTVRKLVSKDIIVPNIISSDESSIDNTFFYPSKNKDYNAIVAEMSIYDRWGNRVFTNAEFEFGIPEEGWNGRFNSNKVVPGVYVYVIKVVDIDTNEVQTFSGDVTVIR